MNGAATRRSGSGGSSTCCAPCGEGEVTTYGDVADTAGYPKRSRLVGRILATTDAEVPWWRVVNASGQLRAHDVREQAALLRSEDVDVRRRARPQRPVGTVQSAGPPRRRALDLHERQPDVVQRITHGGRLVTEPVAEAVDEAGHGVDRQRRLDEVGWGGRQVDGGQLVQPHHVVGDHHLGRARRRAGPGPRPSPAGLPRWRPSCRHRSSSSWSSSNSTVESAASRRRVIAVSSNQSSKSSQRFHRSRAVPYRSTTEAKWGKPPPGHRPDALETSNVRSGHKAETSHLHRRHRPVVRCVGRSACGSRRAPIHQTHGEAHCTGVSSHSTATRTAWRSTSHQRPHPIP